MAAIAAVPTQANGHAFLQVQDIAPFGCNLSNHLVAGHERVLRHAPLVVDHAQIAVAYAAVKNVNFHFVGMEFAHFVAERLKWTARFENGIGINGLCCAHSFRFLILELMDITAKNLFAECHASPAWRPRSGSGQYCFLPQGSQCPPIQT